jgi:exodeoxyribonuclease X
MNIQEAIFGTLDTETTGLDPTAGHQIVEFAFVATSATAELDHATTLVNPGRPIPPEASAIHHLINEDVAGAPDLPGAVGPIMMEFTGHYGPFGAYVAHNAPFDSAFLPAFIDAPWLDTLRLAKRLHPDFDQHGNEFLRYKLGITYPGIRDEVPHRALHDARVTAALLRFFIHEIVTVRADFPQNIEDLIAFIARPMILAAPVQFGKWRGTPWNQVDKGYLKWITIQPDFDIDIMATARHFLGYR